MSKVELIALLVAKKEEKVAAVSADFDLLIEAANSLEVGGDVEALQAEIADLKGKLDSKELELVDAKSKLASVDALAKQIDSIVPDSVG